MNRITIGVLAFHGDVGEHVRALAASSKVMSLPANIVEVRTRHDVTGLAGLIIPGGESTTLYKLCVREGMWEDMKQIPAIFGTCAGAIMLSKHVAHKEQGQQTLELMDITIDRNAYGRQTDSFEEVIHTTLGDVNAVFIRAPRIQSVGKNVTVLATKAAEIIACEEFITSQYYLASCFHPELTTTLFHEYFLRKICE